MSNNGNENAVDQLTGAELWTIGEADHDSGQLIDLLAARGINRLVDVRRIPMSLRRPDYSIKTLPTILQGREISYEYMGDRLHGLPRSPGTTCVAGGPTTGPWRNFRTSAPRSTASPTWRGRSARRCSARRRTLGHVTGRAFWGRQWHNAVTSSYTSGGTARKPAPLPPSRLTNLPVRADYG